MRDEERYFELSSLWYDRWWSLNEDAPPRVRYCSVSCVCKDCLQADHNVSHVFGMPLQVTGL